MRTPALQRQLLDFHPVLSPTQGKQYRLAGRLQPWTWSRAARRAVSPNECVGRRVVVETGVIVGLQLGDDLLGECLPEFDAPLVEGVDLPDGTLYEHFV